MKSFMISKLRRRGRALLAVAIAAAALVWLLGNWSQLPSVAAHEPLATLAGTDAGGADLTVVNSEPITYYSFLPTLFKSELSDIVFSDNFSSSSSGWPTGDDGDCEYEYRDGRYRIKVTDYGERCYAPNLLIPKQVNGTFSVRVRRRSDEDRHMLYGLIFGAKPVPHAAENHWALEIYPNDDSDCNDKPFFWLVAVVDGDREYFRDKCTDSIDKDENDWNELMVIRNGQHIDVYINGDHKGDYNDADELLAEGYSFVEVVSVSNETITVEFDDFEIRRSTDAP